MVTGHGIRSTLGQNWEFSEGEATLPLKWRGEVVNLAPASVWEEEREAAMKAEWAAPGVNVGHVPSASPPQSLLSPERESLQCSEFCTEINCS